MAVNETIIYNGKAVLPDGIAEPGYVRMREGIIVEATAGGPPAASGEEMFDALGGWIAPGLTDIHTHGCGGAWGFMEADEILKMAAALAKFGVTSFTPATVSLPRGQIKSSIAAIRAAMERQKIGADFTKNIPENSRPSGARILGIHLEGPYISGEKPGAHLPPCIRPPKEDEVAEILELAGGALKIVTLAPEIPGGMELIELLSSHGIVASIGHSNADSSQTLEAVRRGARHFSHLFNAVRTFHQREPGCAFAALNIDEMSVEIILDNVHVHPGAAKIALASKPDGKVVLVSDSISAAGLAEGAYNVWGFEVLVKDGAVKTKDGTMAGSVLTLNRAVKNAVELLGAPPDKAFRMASRNPMSVLGLENLAGELRPGAAADVAVFDSEFNCSAAFIAGLRVEE